MSVNVEAMVRNGVEAFRAGKKEEARALLMLAVEKDQFNEQAWLWLSAVVDTPDDQRTCLENVLAINPNNERAKQGMAALNRPDASAPPATGQPPAPSSQQAAQPASPFTSVEWGEPETSSPSATYRPGPEPDYDDWLQTLNIASSPEGKPGANVADAGSMSTPFDDDDSMFDGPFSAPQFDVSTTPPPPAKSGGKSPMSPGQSAPSAKNVSPPPSKSAPATLTKQNVAKTDDFAYIDSLGLEPEDRDVQEAGADEDDLMMMIPPEIKATRLPGTNGPLPIVAVILLLLLIAANAAAALFLVKQLQG